MFLLRTSPLLILASLLLAGCSTIDKRIAENAELFKSLDGETQQAIREGNVNIGFTQTMVYMALGKPSTVKASADGNEVTWTFIYFNTPEGNVVRAPNAYVGSATGMQALFNPTSRRMTPKMYQDAYQSKPQGTVAGAADLMRGNVRAPDDRIRDATMRDMLEGPRQDLLIKFKDGAVSGFELMQML